MANIGILGAGSWGTALAILLENNGHQVQVWSALEEEVEMLSKEREHKSKLPGVPIPKDMVFTSNMEDAVKGKDFIVMAVPSPFTRKTAQKMSSFVADGQIIVDVAKGIEDGSLKTLSAVIGEELPMAEAAVLSGPSHAEEVGREIPTTAVAGAKKKETAEFMQNIFMNQRFRVYTSPDMLGIELGGALKNVIALAAGVADGLGCGDNTKAALMTRGMTEMSRLGIAMGGKAETFAGLSGIGDLIVTCTSMHSRNRRAGILLGKRKSLSATLAEVKMVVEGINTVQAACELAKKYHVSMPITQEINQVLFYGKNVREAVLQLMTRNRKAE